MDTTRCINCHKKIDIPDEDSVVTCPYCKTKIKITHLTTFEFIKEISKSAGQKVNQFVDEHPKLIRGGVVAIIGGAAVLLGISKIDDLLQSASVNNTSGYLPSNQSDDTPELPSTDPTEATDESRSDLDYLSYLADHCYNCGASLANAYYTDPWEDGDNEYGYWTCPQCGAINEDWNSVDDD